MKDKELQKQFINFLQQKSGAKTQKELENYIKDLKQQGKLEDVYKEFTNKMTEEQNKQTRKALHGAKLNYIKGLKHICNDDEELVYYKKGGSIDCGCVKKQLTGGEVPSNPKKSKNDWKAKVRQNLEKPQMYDYKTGGMRKPTKEELARQAKNREETAKTGKQGNHIQGSAEQSKKVKTHYNGAKVKAGSNGCVAKFKKRFQQGGSLNGTPFIRRVRQRTGYKYF